MKALYNSTTKTSKEIDAINITVLDYRKTLAIVDFADERFSILIKILVDAGYVIMNEITNYRQMPTYSLEAKGIYAVEKNLPLLLG
jgi:hypothetical protein